MISLRKIVTEFRKGILGNRDSHLMCAVVCYPLQGYLSFLGYRTEIVEVDFGMTNHIWLKLPDGQIIDPTADQFSGPTIKLPKVYIGPLPDIYRRWVKQEKISGQ